MLFTESQMPKRDNDLVMIGGYAIDVPLGMQEPSFFWHQNYMLVEAIRDARTKAGIVVVDDFISDAESTVVVDIDDSDELPVELPAGKRATKKLERKDDPGVAAAPEAEPEADDEQEDPDEEPESDADESEGEDDADTQDDEEEAAEDDSDPDAVKVQHGDGKYGTEPDEILESWPDAEPYVGQNFEGERALSRAQQMLNGDLHIPDPEEEIGPTGWLEEKGTPGVFPAQLKKYWLGKGLARWATTPTPYRSLVAALRSEGVSGRMVNGLAARLYHWHFGKWPGKHGKKSWSKTETLLTKGFPYLTDLETK